MERHPTTSTVSIDKRNKGTSAAAGAEPLGTVIESNARELLGHEGPSTAAQSVSVWRHTLVLTGELTHRSAHTLELELERLCEGGVTAITLDLRQLAQIDSIGVAVIAFRCGLYRRRGLAVALIPGSRQVQRAFVRAGVDDLPFQVDEVAARRLRARAREAFSRRR
jgi:anti-anti-sigma factor